jgi:hypothetical protein
MHHFLQSELLSRRLAYFCCKRLSIMFNEYSQKFFDPTLKQLQNLSNNSLLQLQLIQIIVIK